VTTLSTTTDLCKLLGDPTRLRLLALLQDEALTVAELTAAIELPQPRVSTHLGRLKDGGLVADRRAGSSAWYRLHPRAREMPLVRAALAGRDPLMERDRERMERIVAARGQGSWADRVAGAMERHYSPGRTWEALARGLCGMLELGRVLDIAAGDGAVARLVAPFAQQVVCLDHSERVLERGRSSALENMEFVLGDMHELPFDDQHFDHCLLLTALVYAEHPQQVLAEATRVLRPGGRLVATALSRHAFRDVVAPYDHLHQGFTPEQLRAWSEEVGLRVRSCRVTSREGRAPNFEVLTLVAERNA
jgi:SAM-dependent methyltransferase